ncbi:alpha/beta hydrolase [Butyrivibrio sp. AE3004]|uniref:alpha/beta hydrolase n=1 Tax=Butyrivibrio sp. AE3004 TaxID=1506994 RepID=UPI000493C229|nr:hypothetical protein [Butyrivibrio sp. AE3004]
MNLVSFNVGSKECVSYVESNPECVIIQLIGEIKSDSLLEEIKYIKKRSDISLAFVFCKIDDWNRELSPWNAKPVFGDEPFGSGAEETLEFLENDLIPKIISSYGLSKGCHFILAGYSLAGLFTLWSVYQKGIFEAAAAVSPSVWFPGWIDYAGNHEAITKNIYMSLGDKEEKTRNAVMKSVGDCIRRQKDILEMDNSKNVVLEWNEGNHFRDIEIRCAKGVLWCLDKVQSN